MYLNHKDDFYTKQYRNHTEEEYRSHVKPLLPLNTLRNVAVDLTTTQYVFPVSTKYKQSSLSRGAST